MSNTPTRICERCGVSYAKPPSDSVKVWAKRKYCSSECSIAMTFRKGRAPWNKGLKGFNKHVPRTEEWRRNISRGQKGKPRPHTRGEQHHNWKGGISKHRRDLRSLEYVAWRERVFQRDDFTCQMPGCGIRGGDLESHHIVPWAESEDLRFEIANGVTLCRSCHRKTKGHEKEYVETFLGITFTRA